MRPMRRPWLAVAITLAAGRVLAGDPDVASLLFKKAKKSFAAKDYKEAETGFRRAIKEMSPYPEARLCLGETLEKLDRPREAIEEYRTCVGEINDAGAPSKWKPQLARAQQAITRLQGRHAELAKLNDAFIRKCIDFGRKRSKSDPYWARKALETALRLDPANAVARGLLETTPAGVAEEPAPEVAKPAKGESLFRRDLWDGPPEWSVTGDTIAGDVREADGRLFWLEKVWTGRYTIRGRVRLTRDGGARRAYGLMFGGDGKPPWWALVFEDSEQLVFQHWTDDEQKHLKEHLLADYDHSQWHAFEVAVDHGTVSVKLDGNEVFAMEEASRTCFDGKFSLFIQNGRVEWTDLEVVK